MIIVTGGAGFIGSAFVWKLNQEGIDDIVIVDELRQITNGRTLLTGVLLITSIKMIFYK